MEPVDETHQGLPGRLRRARVLYRNVSKRRLSWLLLKDTVQTCMRYRVTGLAAEAAFFCLLSLPPLLLGLIGLLGYLSPWVGAGTLAHIRADILHASSAVLSPKGVNGIARPLLDDVFTGRRPDVVSLGFAIALWSGSRAVNVFVDTITIMYGLEGRRGIVRTRLLAFVLYLVALVLGAVALPLMVAGPGAVVGWLPESRTAVEVLYWPVVVALSVAFLTTLYHLSVPVRTPWREDVPGAVMALAIWVLGSFLLRLYLEESVEGPTIYGSLAAPVAVLLWIGVSAFAVLVGAAVNAALDRVWPSVATAAGRAERERLAKELAAVREAAARKYAGATAVADHVAPAGRSGRIRRSGSDGEEEAPDRTGPSAPSTGQDTPSSGPAARRDGADGSRSPDTSRQRPEGGARRGGGDGGRGADPGGGGRGSGEGHGGHGNRHEDGNGHDAADPPEGGVDGGADPPDGGAGGGPPAA